MDSRKHFIMALYAVKPDPEFCEVVEEERGRISYRVYHRDGEMHLSSPVVLMPHAEFAETAEEARQMGLTEALTRWPRTDGWVGHTCAVASFSLEEALRWTSHHHLAGGEAEDTEDDGMIM